MGRVEAHLVPFPVQFAGLAAECVSLSTSLHENPVHPCLLWVILCRQQTRYFAHFVAHCKFLESAVLRLCYESWRKTLISP